MDLENLVNGSVDRSLFNSMLNMYGPLKKVSIQNLKFRNKPRITLDLQNSISIKNYLLTKYIKLKDIILKTEAKIRYKQYRNLLSTLMKKSKRFYYKNHFQNNLNDLKSIRKGIKKIISLKELSNIALYSISTNGRSLTEPQDITNAFAKYFVNVVTDIQSFVRYSKNNVHGFLPPINIIFFSIPLMKFKLKI